MVSSTQTNFTAGELSPKLVGRHDLAKRANGARRLLNMVVLKHGSLTRRPGTRHVAEVGDQTAPGRLLPFEFSTEQAYVLALFPGGLHLFRNHGRMMTAPTDAAIVNGGFTSGLSGWNTSGASVSDGGADLAPDGYIEQTITVSDPTSEIVLAWRVAAGGAGKSHSASLTIGTTSGGGDIVDATGAAVGWHVHGFTPGSGNTTIHVRFSRSAGTPRIAEVSILNGTAVRLGTPYGTQDDLETVQWAQSADVLYLASRQHPPYRLSRAGLSQWSLELIDFVDDPFDATGKYPGTVTFHEDRLCWGGTNDRPQTIWMSRSGDYEVLTTGAEADDAIEVTLSADQVNAIRWMRSGDSLFVGTVGGEWRVFASNLGEALAPDTVNAKRSTTQGSAFSMALKIDDVLLYVQRSRRKVREFAYVFDADAFRSPDLTVLADHIGRRGLGHLVYQQEPHGIVWTHDDDGRLLGLTYDREQNVVGWHAHRLGGRLEDGPARVEGLAVIPAPDGATDELWLIVNREISGSAVRSIERLSPFFQPDEPWLADTALFLDSCLSFDGWNAGAQRTLTFVGTTLTEDATGTLTASGHAPFDDAQAGDQFRLRRRIHDPVLDQHTAAIAQVEVVSITSSTEASVRLTRTLPPALVNWPTADWAKLATNLSGLDHLEGETVSILADAAVLPDRVVQAGSITVETPSAKVHVGLPCPALLESLPFAIAGSAEGGHGRKQAIDRVTLDFIDTNGAAYGSSANRLFNLPFRRGGDPMDSPVPLFEGLKDVPFTDRIDRSAVVFVRQDLPLPLTIRSIIPTMRVFS